MPNIKNVTKQVQSVSPYNPSTNSSILQNNIDTSLNGTSSTSQKIQKVSLNTTDFDQINQSQKQDGFFVSKTDKEPIYDLSQSITEYNKIKQLETGVGVPYSYLNSTSVEEKYNRVRQDFLVKNKTFTINNDSYLDKIETIVNSMNDTYKNNRSSTIGNPFNISPSSRWFSSNKGSFTDIRKSGEDSKYSVLIQESREGTQYYREINSSIENQGSFDREVVTIKILSNVQNFSFGTTQTFEDVEPRGAQTPLRFYKGNPGRTLGFSAEFYQQEYPKEPLLNIAEKAQYLCRPYKHGDYSVIPKLVLVNIPGRTFRGYLSSASVTYSYDMGDYSNWDIKKVSDVMNNPNVSLGNYNARMIETEITGSVSGGYNYERESIDYGLGKMTIDFTLLIVEEIKLTTYETNIERQIRETREKIELLPNTIDEYRIRVEMEKNEFFATGTPKQRELIGYDSDDLILVNPATGEVILAYDEEGNLITDLDGFMTVAEYEYKKNNPEQFTESQNADLFRTNQAVYDAMGSQTKNEIIDALLELDSSKYKREDLENMDIYELTNIRDQEIIERSEDDGQMVDVVNDFAMETQYYDEDGELIYADTNVLNKSQFNKLRELLLRSSYDAVSIQDLQNFVREYGIDYSFTETIGNNYGVNFFNYPEITGYLQSRTYPYSNILLYDTLIYNYGIENINDIPYMNFNNIPDSILSEHYRNLFVKRCGYPDGKVPVGVIRTSEFEEYLTMKDATDLTFFQFFCNFYKDILSYNKDFYQDAVDWALSIFGTEFYFPDEELGKKKFTNVRFVFINRT